MQVHSTALRTTARPISYYSHAKQFCWAGPYVIPIMVDSQGIKSARRECEGTSVFTEILLGVSE